MGEIYRGAVEDLATLVRYVRRWVAPGPALAPAGADDVYFRVLRHYVLRGLAMPEAARPRGRGRGPGALEARVSRALALCAASGCALRAAPWSPQLWAGGQLLGAMDANLCKAIHVQIQQDECTVGEETLLKHV